MKKSILILITFVLTISTLSFANSVFYVSPTGSSNGDGSEKSPCRFLSQAYSLAVSSNENSVVQILPGTFYETNTLFFGSEKILICGSGDQSIIQDEIIVTSNISFTDLHIQGSFSNEAFVIFENVKCDDSNIDLLSIAGTWRDGDDKVHVSFLSDPSDDFEAVNYQTLKSHVSNYVVDADLVTEDYVTSAGFVTEDYIENKFNNLSATNITAVASSQSDAVYIVIGAGYEACNGEYFPNGEIYLFGGTTPPTEKPAYTNANGCVIQFFSMGMMYGIYPASNPFVPYYTCTPTIEGLSYSWSYPPAPTVVIAPYALTANGRINLNGNKIVNIANGENPTDGVNKGYVDAADVANNDYVDSEIDNISNIVGSNYVSKIGDTMAGSITFTNRLINGINFEYEHWKKSYYPAYRTNKFHLYSDGNNLISSVKMWQTNSGCGYWWTLKTPVENNGNWYNALWLTRRPEYSNYTHNTALRLFHPLLMNNEQIHFLADPSDPQDAATRSYVDNKQFSSDNISDGAITTDKILNNTITLDDLDTTSIDSRYISKTETVNQTMAGPLTVPEINVQNNWVITDTKVIAINNNSAGTVASDSSDWSGDNCVVPHGLDIANGEYIVMITPKSIVSGFAVTSQDANNFTLTKNSTDSTFTFDYLIIKK